MRNLPSGEDDGQAPVPKPLSNARHDWPDMPAADTPTSACVMPPMVGGVVETLASDDLRCMKWTLARELLAMTQEDLSSAFKHSPMKRAKLRGLKRNAAVVLGNVDTGDGRRAHPRTGRRRAARA